MALKEMRAICEAAVVKHSLQGIAILHKVGDCPVSEASVIIVAVSAHRRAAIEAASEAIDTLKETVPIWKKEFYAQEQGLPSMQP